MAGNGRLGKGQSVGEVRVCDADTGRELLDFQTGPLNQVACNTLAFSPDGKRLVVRGADTRGPELFLFDAANGNLILRLHGAAAETAKAAIWSPDGKRLAAISRDVTAIWDATTGELLRTLGDQGADHRALL
jgi:WD40 repeat protein